MKIPAASCRESPKCKEVNYCNSLALSRSLSGRMRSLCIFKGLLSNGFSGDNPCHLIHKRPSMRTDKLKIAVPVKRFITTGGVERYSVEVTRRLLDKGHAIDPYVGKGGHSFFSMHYLKWRTDEWPEINPR